MRMIWSFQQERCQKECAVLMAGDAEILVDEDIYMRHYNKAIQVHQAGHVSNGGVRCLLCIMPATEGFDVVDHQEPQTPGQPLL